MGSRIEIGNYEIIESNFVLMNKSEQKLTIGLTINNRFCGNICIDFVSNESDKISAETKVIGDELHFTCYNFDKNEVVGTDHPTEIGQMDGKKICLYLCCSRIGHGEVRKVEYTVYKEK